MKKTNIQKPVPIPETKTEPKKTTFEDIFRLQTFSIPNTILQDNRQGQDNVIVSEQDIASIMSSSHLREICAKKTPGKKKFQYF